MKRSQNDTVHRVRAVRSWLEKAEASFDEESDIKGELNLMLAEAEMKNLRRHHPFSKGLLRLGAALTALCLAGGGWYLLSRPLSGSLAPAASAVQQAPPGEAPQRTVPDSVPEAAPAADPADPADSTAPSPAETVPPPASTAAAESRAALPEDSTPAVPPAAEARTPPQAVPAKKAVLSDRQVQAAVQDARHTLRGTSSTK